MQHLRGHVGGRPGHEQQKMLVCCGRNDGADDGHGGPQDNDAANAIIGIGQLGDGTDDNQDRGGLSGYLYLFNPASTVFEKHFISKMTGAGHAGTNPYVEEHENAGYFQQTAAITRIRFVYPSNPMRAGRISMYGVAK